MGNKLGRKRQVVDERFTKPQGLYVHKDVDHKKLRKLILESKLAPCFPGDDEYCYDTEECPICFLYYPSLNRSRCCMKGICTECFLQMKNPSSTRPTQCPFCKTSNYAVEYRGVKTKEEKGLEQIEEQRVIEAKIRIRQQELQDEEERTLKRLESTSSSNRVAPGELECGSVLSCQPPTENEEIVSSQPSIRRPSHSGASRDDEFDLDLEDIMVMEAIWLSIQENGWKKKLIFTDTSTTEQYATTARYTSPAISLVAGTSSSPSGGLACAIAALAERQHMGGEFSIPNNGNMSSHNLLPSGSSSYNRLDMDGESYVPAQSSMNVPPDCRMEVTRDDVCWGAGRASDAAEAGTSYASSDTAEDSGGISALLSSPPLPPNVYWGAGRVSDAAEAGTSYSSSDTTDALLPPPPPPPPPPDGSEGSFHDATDPIVPESFEEQMMLAMAVSLAEARAVTSVTGSTWK